MATTGNDFHRVRLEGGAELLELTGIRYRGLVAILKSLRWRNRLRANAALLRGVVTAEPWVERVLASASRRAAAEAWSSHSEVARCVRQVGKLKEELVRTAATRLERRSGDLCALLLELEARVVRAPVTVLPGRRWATALELLPPGLPEVVAAARFGRRVEQLFSRPMTLDGALRLSKEEAELLPLSWGAGRAALRLLWERLGQADSSGGLVASFERRAGRAPGEAPRNGPEVLLHAEFWRRVASARLAAVGAAVFSPVEPTEPELVATLGWLRALEEAPDVRLVASGALSPSRASLMELCQALSCLVAAKVGPCSPEGLQARWKRLEQRAREADLLASNDPAAERVREGLRGLLRLRVGRDERLWSAALKAGGPGQEGGGLTFLDRVVEAKSFARNGLSSERIDDLHPSSQRS